MAETEIFFKIDETAYNDLVHGRNGDVYKEIEKRAHRLQLLAIKQVGKNTGGLAKSIKVTMLPSAQGPYAIVGSDHRIALIHHNGTRPHEIRPKHARMLRFSHRGKIVYARRVMHPGTRPNRYLSDNLRRVVVD